MKNFRKIISIFLIAVLLVSSIPFSNGVNAEGLKTVKIYASKIKNEKSEYYQYETLKSGNKLTFVNKGVNIEFVIDQDVELDSLNSYNANTLTISGNKKLTVDLGFYDNGSYVQETGSNVFVGKNGIYVVGSANIKSGAKLTLDQGDYENEYLPVFYVINDLTISGDVTSKSNYFGIRAIGDINITGGEIRSTAEYTPLMSDENNINISGGNVYLYASSSCSLKAEGSINISGGYIESVMEQEVYDAEGESSLMNIVASDSINITSPMYIKVPEKGSVLNDTSYPCYTIINKNGKYPIKVIISENAEEVAAKKAAEDAAKKANGAVTNNAADKSTNKSIDKTSKKYSNEWVDGKWYNADGTQTYTGTLSWKSNSTGWWVEDTFGWYPVSQWQKIDGKWYYFLDSGYMDYSEYRDGCWLGSDGAWDENYSNGTWHLGSKGWWYSDGNWYPANQNLWIDGTNYFFNSEGYWQ